MKTRKLLAMLLVLIIVLSLTACTGSDGDSSSQAPTATAEPTQSASTDNTQTPTEDVADGSIVYPIAGEGLELTFWGTFNSPSGAYIENYEDFPALKLAEERTGVQVTWLSFSPPAANEQFPISIASGDLPDVYRNFMQYYPGSGAQANDQDLIIDMTDLIPEFAPDYYSILTADESKYRDAVDDDGNMWAVWHFIQKYYSVEGLLIRQDWLNELGMESPTTLEGIEEYLTAIKTEYNVNSPYFLHEQYSGGSSSFAHAYNVGGYNSLDFYDEFMQIDGKVYSSYTQPGYRDYIALMNKWYDAGLFSSDFATVNFNVKSSENIAKIANGETGLFVGQTQTIPDYKAAAADPDYELMGIPNVTVNGDSATHLTNTFARHQRYCWAVTTACDIPEVAIRWMNYFYTEEGIDLVNYGEYGVSWEYVDGVPAFTELITENQNNFENLSITQIANYYCLYQQIYTYSDESRLFQFYSEPVRETIELWTGSRDSEYVMPLGISRTDAENDIISGKLPDIRTYVTENTGKFIIGERSMDEWDAFVEQIYTLGIEDCIAANQAALDRYYAR